MSGVRQPVIGGSKAFRSLRVRMRTESLVLFRPVLGSRTRE